MGFLEERDLTDAPSIPEYYEGKTVFITGGSGFIGKVLIEKLLYSCGGLSKIYLLLREKKGVKSEERLQKIYSLACFNRLREEKPDIFKEKVAVINGDFSDPGLGLTQEDRELLINNVNIVFHVAASVRFDDPLTYAAKLNLRGTKEVTELASEMKNLSSYVHVSTSYSNTNRDPIGEEIYTPLADWRDTLKICEEVDEQTIRTLTPKYLDKLPNTYTFTKQLAEHVVYEYKGQIPAIIIRPSIVIASLDEPFPGWVENFNGPVGIFVACGKGVLRSLHTKPDLVLDYIPVDVCVKHFIAASWIRGTKQLEKSDDIPIYNCTAGHLQTIYMKDVIEMSLDIAQEIPLDNVLWPMNMSMTTDNTLHYLKVIFYHLVPAVFIDMILWVLGHKPMLVKVQRRIYTANSALSYYLTQNWTFLNKNFVDLRSKLKESDVAAFYYNLEDFHIADFFKECFRAGRKYLLKEKDEDIPKARAHLQRMKVLDMIVRAVFYGFILWFVWKSLLMYYGDVMYNALDL